MGEICHNHCILFFHFIHVIMSIHYSAKKKTFQKILKYQQNGFVIGTFSDIDNRNKCIASIHSCLIVKARTLDKKNFILLRNSWGHYEWKGDYS